MHLPASRAKSFYFETVTRLCAGIPGIERGSLSGDVGGVMAPTLGFVLVNLYLFDCQTEGWGPVKESTRNPGDGGLATLNGVGGQRRVEQLDTQTRGTLRNQEDRQTGRQTGRVGHQW